MVDQTEAKPVAGQPAAPLGVRPGTPFAGQPAAPSARQPLVPPGTPAPQAGPLVIHYTQVVPPAMVQVPLLPRGHMWPRLLPGMSPVAPPPAFFPFMPGTRPGRSMTYWAPIGTVPVGNPYTFPPTFQVPVVALPAR